MVRAGSQRRRSRSGTDAVVVRRVQTGVRMEKRILKVLKALAELHDITLGDLLEGIVLHAFEGKPPFQEESLRTITKLKQIYHLDLDASASHRMAEAAGGRGGGRKKRARQSRSAGAVGDKGSTRGG
jgi:hypothetical protein